MSSRYVDPFEAFKAKKEAEKLAPKLEEMAAQTVKNEDVGSTFQSHRYEKKELSEEEIGTVKNLEVFESVKLDENEIQKAPILNERAEKLKDVEKIPVPGFDSGRFQKSDNVDKEVKAAGLVSHMHKKQDPPSTLEKPTGFSKY